MTALVRHVRHTLESRGLLPPDRRLVVAVSGGMDSMVLLDVLRRLARPLSLQLTIAHANHQLRGADSDADEHLVRQVARKWKLPVECGHLAVRDTHHQSQESLEMVARRLRHRFLNRIAGQTGASTLALAHQADDQTELILLRILRGTGGEGLRGMEWNAASAFDSDVRLVRPLLDVRRTEIAHYATLHRIPYREDASNTDPRILRNRIRHDLRPQLERDFNPSLGEALYRLSEITGAEADFVTGEAERWRLNPAGVRFEDLHVAVQRAVLRLQLWELGQPGDFELVERLRQRPGPATGPGAVELERFPDGAVRVCPSRLTWAFQTGQATIDLGNRLVRRTLSGTCVSLRLGPLRAIPKQAKKGVEYFDGKQVGSNIILRHWSPGDRFQPLGFPRPAKIQDLLVNRKVPSARRRTLVLATTSAGTIFWVEGLPPGEAFKVTPGSDCVLTLKWRAHR